MTIARDLSKILDANGDLTIDTNTLFVDSSTNRVGIGTSSPSRKLHISTSEQIISRFTTTNTLGLVSIEDTNTTGENYVSVGSEGNNMFFRAGGSEKLRIDSSGNVGIGNSTPSSFVESSRFVVGSGTSGVNEMMFLYSGTNTFGALGFADGTSSTNRYRGMIGYDHNTDAMFISTAGGGSASRDVTVDNSGNVGIGTSSPTNFGSNFKMLAVEGSDFGVVQSVSNSGSVTTEMMASASVGFIGTRTNHPFVLRTNDTEQMRIDSSGNVNIGTSSTFGGGESLTVKRATVSYNPTDNGYACYIYHADNSSTADGLLIANNWQASTSKLLTCESISAGTGAETVRFEVDGVGNVFIDGSLSKGSGSFRIDHPLPEKTNTHNLVHSFVEAPQADNIYRGKIDLVNGTATVNIDTVAGMSEGTFILLNREVQCFTSNETGWTAVKGSVSDNILTITAQDETCADTISWLVIGERQDQHMYDTEWTDENGKVIVEPLKPVEKETIE